MAGNIKICTVNVTDKVGCLNPRDAFFAKTKMGTNWLEARMGMFYTFVPAANDDAPVAANETILPASCLDWFTFGLKNSDNANCPGRASARFVGNMVSADLATNVVLAKNDVASGSLASSSHLMAVSYDGVTLITGINTAVTMQFPIWAAGNVNAFWGYRFTVQNYGLANETITAYPQNSGTTAQTDVSSAALRNSCFNTALGTARILNWFSGGVALPLPDAVWIRSPMNLNRLRITNVDCWKVAA